MNTSDRKQKVTTSLDNVRLHYARPRFNKKKITKATLDYYSRSRLVRRLSASNRLLMDWSRKAAGKAIRFFSRKKTPGKKAP
jgi:hypothetical protein